MTLVASVTNERRSRWISFHLSFDYSEFPCAFIKWGITGVLGRTGLIVWDRPVQTGHVVSLVLGPIREGQGLCHWCAGRAWGSHAGRATRQQLGGNKTQAYSQSGYQACLARRLPLLGALPPLGGPVETGDLPALDLAAGGRGPAAPLRGQSHGARSLAPREGLH